LHCGETPTPNLRMNVDLCSVLLPIAAVSSAWSCTKEGLQWVSPSHVLSLIYREIRGQNHRTLDSRLAEQPHCLTRAGETHLKPPSVLVSWLWNFDFEKLRFVSSRSLQAVFIPASSEGINLGKCLKTWLFRSRSGLKSNQIDPKNM
jgi:hypothetical protein